MSVAKDNSSSRNNLGQNNNERTKSPSSPRSDNEDTHYTRVVGDNGRYTETKEVPSNDQSTFVTSPSTDIHEWKCRECGYINEESDTVCDTCGTNKPLCPSLETHPNYSETRSSRSSSDQRSSFPEKETTYNRAGSLSPVSSRRQDSSREQSPSKANASDNERSPTPSSTGSRGRRRSSQSYSSDDNQDSLSMDTTRQGRASSNSSEKQSSSRGSSLSKGRNEERSYAENYMSGAAKTIPDPYSNDDQSYEYGKNGCKLHSRTHSPLPKTGSSTTREEEDRHHVYDSLHWKEKDDLPDTPIGFDSKLESTRHTEEDEYQRSKLRQDSIVKTMSTLDSSLPKKDYEQKSSSVSDKEKDHRSIQTIAKPVRSAEISDDAYKTESKQSAFSASSTVYGSGEYGKSDNKSYPELHPSLSPRLSHEKEKKHDQRGSTGKLATAPCPTSHASSYQDRGDQSARTTTVQRKSSPSPSSSSRRSKRDDPIVVYVPDLPVNSGSPESLENMIRQCLELSHKQKIRDIKCYTELGIGVIHIDHEDDKDNLIHKITKIIIEKSNNTTVSLVDELDLISYVVIHSNETKNLPTVDGIRQRWVQLYKPHSQPKCEHLSVQFPNIFRIITHSLDELIDALSTKEFSVDNQLATVYFRADCCFFEDLPRTTSSDRLKAAISNQITEKYVSKELMHIQYNKKEANAIVLTSGRARIWSLHHSVTLDERLFLKKDSLACRLLIRNVPKTVSTSLIREHKIFANTVIKILPSSDHVILELSDKSVYEKCVEQGALRVDDHPFSMEVYSSSSNPEDSEIDAQTWYETEMCDHKPDIMRFMSDPQHHIFRYKWNSQAFLEQFRRWTSTNGNPKDKNLAKQEKLGNLQRHRLRMTVMLNTIGVIKRGYYRVGEKEMKLKPDRLKTIVYTHKSKLQHEKIISLSQATSFPYKHTSVKVANEDCLIVYKKLVSDGYRPVILNMANADNPGGGYRRGDGAQEETIFRRSNYFQSLDRELDDGKPSARFYCNPNGDLHPLTERNDFYPMDEFGAIYTSGLTVFRQSEETGYTFMDIPMYDVCAIAMAGYRDPKVDNKNLLIPKYSIGTRKKIENIFAIAHQHKHDCLVLSALGCGAFRNPPDHIATIFKSVIEQYAGYFKCIYFAIIDDHNARQDLNPTGNYRPFRKILDDYDIEPNKHRLIDMMLGPWRILNQTSDKDVTLSDIKICHLNPCHNGGKCNDSKNEAHCREYSHPPLCPYTTNVILCKEKNDDQHMLWFRHRLQCKYGGECRLIDHDQAHSIEFEHPVFCSAGSTCENLDHDHLKSYRHVPLCKYLRRCVDYNRGPNEHCTKYRHCTPMCRFGKFCVRFHDEKHLQEENHPFKPPCPFTPFHCRDYNTLSQANNIKTLPIHTQNHCLQYSHLCRYGRQCHETSEVHLESTIHVARHMCSLADRCTKLSQEDHLNSFSHPGIADIRRLCSQQGCDCRDKRKVEHIKHYRHDGNHDLSGVIGYFGQNKAIDFIDNQDNIIKVITDYTSHGKQTLSISKEIRKFIKSLQPIHRCSKVIFESILVHGHVMSREHMQRLKHSRFAAQAVQEHKHVRAIFDRYKMAAIADHAKEYIRAIVSQEYSKKYTACPSAETMFTGSTKTDTSDDPNEIIRREERFLRNMLKPDEIDVIRKRAVAIAEASWNLHNSPTGIKYEPDKILGTDKHVFAILGPHLGHYYGDIFLAFKSEVMLHPDANFSPQAGTSFVSGRTFANRPWVKDPGSEHERVKCFHASKLHCSIPGYEHAAAAELIAVTGSRKKTVNVEIKDILDRWKKADSHEVFEAHLPQLVPLDYIDAVYIPKNLFDSLTPAAQESARKTFRHSLHITDHEITLTDASGASVHSLDKSRSKYQDFVIDQLIEKLQRRMERTTHLYGTVITLASSQFTDHIVLPVRLDKACEQYHRTHKRDLNVDDVYIYWQAMYGDMMVTLSTEPLDCYASQPNIRCLVCYIAERPSTTTTTYNESYSYLNASEPYRHSVIMTNGQCSGSSRSFHRGCNIEDFLTYCLKLEKKTGQVTVSHAGPNSIYCYETIKCNFPKTTLDLNKLRYIHVSAGAQKVPIRNLIISFEPITDLHPTVDKNFKPATDTLPRDRKTRDSDRSSSPSATETVREKSPSLINKAAHAFINFFGYDGADKKLQPCPDSIHCLSRDSPKHMQEYLHACPYSELCTNQDKEPHLTHEPHRAEQCPSKTACRKLDDPVHRAKYRHTGYPDFLIPCRDRSNCRDQASKHRLKYSHGKHIEVKKDVTNNATHDKSSTEHEPEASSYVATNDQQKIACRYASECRNQTDSDHCLKYSHPHRSARSNHDLTVCRHGRDCRDKNDPHHCSKFSHPSGHGSKSSAASTHDKIPCRYEHGCRDKNDPAHCSKYSHPSNHGVRPSSGSSHTTPCRFGRNCRDKNDREHCLKYSHPNK